MAKGTPHTHQIEVLPRIVYWPFGDKARDGGFKVTYGDTVVKVVGSRRWMRKFGSLDNRVKAAICLAIDLHDEGSRKYQAEMNLQKHVKEIAAQVNKVSVNGEPNNWLGTRQRCDVWGQELLPALDGKEVPTPPPVEEKIETGATAYPRSLSAQQVRAAARSISDQEGFPEFAVSPVITGSYYTCSMCGTAYPLGTIHTCSGSMMLP